MAAAAAARKHAGRRSAAQLSIIVALMKRGESPSVMGQEQRRATAEQRQTTCPTVLGGAPQMACSQVSFPVLGGTVLCREGNMSLSQRGGTGANWQEMDEYLKVGRTQGKEGGAKEGQERSDKHKT